MYKKTTRPRRNKTLVMSDCLSGKSTRGMPSGRFVGEEGIPEPRVEWLRDDARICQVRAAWRRNTLRPAFCVLELGLMREMLKFFSMDPLTTSL